VHQGGGLVDEGLVGLGAEDGAGPGSGGGAQVGVAHEVLALVDGADLPGPVIEALEQVMVDRAQFGEVTGWPGS
jgi:hypothetical protein